MANRVGLSYPLKLVNGKLVLAEDEQLITQAIVQVLETRPGERVMRPDYGTADQIWESLAPVLVAEEVLQALKSGIVRDYPGLRFQVQADEPDDSGAFLLNVYWQIGKLPTNTLTLRIKN